MSGKNLLRKLTAAAAGVAVGAMCCMSVFANDIGWDHDPCPVCKEGSVWVREEFERSYPSGEQEDCKHYRFGKDVEIINHYVIHYECRDCGYSDTKNRRISYWKCCGFDNPLNQ